MDLTTEEAMRRLFPKKVIKILKEIAFLEFRNNKIEYFKDVC